ncbi:MAG: hypothetical protein L0221_16875 [Chloroflexi bacterium]|nr:hypothetical protein [Chloroflexota bacterium]
MIHASSILAALVMLGLMSLGDLIDPSSTYACSCVPPRPIAEYRGNPEYAVLVGRVANVDANQRGTFAVEQWFQGGAAPIVPIQGGMGADCGLPISAGQHLVLVSFVEGGVVHAGVCSPSGDLSTADGQALALEVVTAFGPGVPADGDPPDAGGVPVGVLVGISALVLLVAAVMLVARRERT